MPLQSQEIENRKEIIRIIIKTKKKKNRITKVTRGILVVVVSGSHHAVGLLPITQGYISFYFVFL
jgi:hypothetical protein